MVAKRYIVRGRVQGVGYRAFVEQKGLELGVGGWVRNLADGTVEVYAVGTAGQLSELESSMWKGPWLSEVRGVNGREDVIDSDAAASGFRIRY